MTSERIPVLLDTDLGDDIDDAWALSVCLNHPGLELLGVSTVWQDTQLRAAQARYLLELAGRRDVEVAAGSRDALDRINHLPRNCQADVLDAATESRLRAGRDDAVSFLAEQVERRPGAVLLTIGPLTNAARLRCEFPESFAKLSRVVVMGGHIMPDRPEPEYNVMCDPRASQIVYECGKPLAMIGLDVTLRCVMTAEDLAAIGAKSTPLGQAILRMTELWQRAVTPAGQTPHMPCVHDPLAALAVAEPDILEWQTLDVYIDHLGRCVVAEGPADTQVAVGVDPERVRRRVVELVG